jgi:hypothetical protein
MSATRPCWSCNGSAHRCHQASHKQHMPHRQRFITSMSNSFGHYLWQNLVAANGRKGCGTWQNHLCRFNACTLTRHLSVAGWRPGPLGRHCVTCTCLPCSGVLNIQSDMHTTCKQYGRHHTTMVHMGGWMVSELSLCDVHCYLAGDSAG